MHINSISIFPVLLSVPAIIVSCTSREPSPDGFIQEFIAIFNNLTKAADSCTSKDISPLMQAWEDATKEVQRLQEIYSNFTDEQKEEAENLSKGPDAKYSQKGMDAVHNYEHALNNMAKNLDAASFSKNDRKAIRSTRRKMEAEFNKLDDLRSQWKQKKLNF